MRVFMKSKIRKGYGMNTADAEHVHRNDDVFSKIST